MKISAGSVSPCSGLIVNPAGRFIGGGGGGGGGNAYDLTYTLASTTTGKTTPLGYHNYDGTEYYHQYVGGWKNLSTDAVVWSQVGYGGVGDQNNLWVYNSNLLFEYDLDTTSATQNWTNIKKDDGTTNVDIVTAAIDNSDPLLGYKTLAVASYGDANIYIYDISAAGTTATYVKKIDASAQLSGAFFQGLAFDLNGNLYGVEASSDTLYVYNVSTGTYTGTTLTVTGLSTAGTLALDIDTTDNSIHQSSYSGGSIKNFTGA